MLTAVGSALQGTKRVNTNSLVQRLVDFQIADRAAEARVCSVVLDIGEDATAYIEAGIPRGIFSGG